MAHMKVSKIVMQQDSWKENREKRSVINRSDGKKSTAEHIYICFLKTIVNPFGCLSAKSEC